MIKQMSNLPDPALQDNTNPQTTGPNPGTQGMAVANTNQNATAGVSGLQKEQEPVLTQETGLTEEVSDIEVSPELERIGVEKRSETIELPPDLQKMGVAATGASQPVTTSTVSLPLSDDQIVKGLHAQIMTSLRWLAEWCIRQLKKTHIRLRRKHGRIEREKK